MNVDESTAPAADKLTAENTHETREADEFYVRCLEDVMDFHVKVFSAKSFVTYNLFRKNVLKQLKICHFEDIAE